MMKEILISCALAMVFSMAFHPAFAADQQERIYGSQLMTQQERIEYRNRIRSAKTEQERERIRMEHHKLMQERAKEQGKVIPDNPPSRGRGMGPGNGMGPGSGRGR